MRLGIQLNNYSGWPGDDARFGPALVEIAQAAEAHGFDRLGVEDHFWQHPILGPTEGPVLECYTTLAFLAAHKHRVRLLATVTAAPYRYPAVLAKTVTTLDILSGGRVWLGIGAGDYAGEAYGLGIPFPSLRERFELLEDTLAVCLRMWSGEHGDERSYHGKHVQVERPLNSPQSLTRPHPPILIGGSGEKTLRLVARYADACNVRPGPDLPHTLDTLRRLCEEEGRAYDTIEKTCMYRFDVGEDGSKVSALIEQLCQLAAAGVQTVIGDVPHIARVTPLEVIGREVVPAVADF